MNLLLDFLRQIALQLSHSPDFLTFWTCQWPSNPKDLPPKPPHSSLQTAFTSSAKSAKPGGGKEAPGGLREVQKGDKYFLHNHVRTARWRVARRGVARAAVPPPRGEGFGVWGARGGFSLCRVE